MSFENKSPTVTIEYTDPSTGEVYKGSFAFKLVPSSRDRGLAGRVRREVWGQSVETPRNEICRQDWDRAFCQGELAWAVLVAPPWFKGDDLPDGVYSLVFEEMSKAQAAHAADLTKRAEEAQARLRADKVREAKVNE